jgi:hypothetical protein
MSTSKVESSVEPPSVESSADGVAETQSAPHAHDCKFCGNRWRCDCEFVSSEGICGNCLYRRRVCTIGVPLR